MADKELDEHIKVCKICGLPKKRIRDGIWRKRKKYMKTPKWLGEDGLLWNGLVCGQCHRNQTAVRMTIKRAIDE